MTQDNDPMFTRATVMPDYSQGMHAGTVKEEWWREFCEDYGKKWGEITPTDVEAILAEQRRRILTGLEEMKIRKKEELTPFDIGHELAMDKVIRFMKEL